MTRMERLLSELPEARVLTIRVDLKTAEIRADVDGEELLIDSLDCTIRQQPDPLLAGGPCQETPTLAAHVEGRAP